MNMQRPKPRPVSRPPPKQSKPPIDNFAPLFPSPSKGSNDHDSPLTQTSLSVAAEVERIERSLSLDKMDLSSNATNASSSHSSRGTKVVSSSSSASSSSGSSSLAPPPSTLDCDLSEIQATEEASLTSCVIDTLLSPNSKFFPSAARGPDESTSRPPASVTTITPSSSPTPQDSLEAAAAAAAADSSSSSSSSSSAVLNALPSRQPSVILQVVAKRQRGPGDEAESSAPRLAAPAARPPAKSVGRRSLLASSLLLSLVALLAAATVLLPPACRHAALRYAFVEKGLFGAGPDLTLTFATAGKDLFTNLLPKQVTAEDAAELPLQVAQPFEYHWELLHSSTFPSPPSSFKLRLSFLSTPAPSLLSYLSSSSPSTFQALPPSFPHGRCLSLGPPISPPLSSVTVALAALPRRLAGGVKAALQGLLALARNQRNWDEGGVGEVEEVLLESCSLELPEGVGEGQGSEELYEGVESEEVEGLQKAKLRGPRRWIKASAAWIGRRLFHRKTEEQQQQLLLLSDGSHSGAPETSALVPQVPLNPPISSSSAPPPSPPTATDPSSRLPARSLRLSRCRFSPHWSYSSGVLSTPSSSSSGGDARARYCVTTMADELTGILVPVATECAEEGEEWDGGMMTASVVMPKWGGAMLRVVSLEEAATIMTEGGGGK